MLHSDRLPTFVFVDEAGADHVLEPRAMVARIRAVAARLQAALRPQAVVGLMFASGPDLVVNWLACLAAQTRPLVMQYPTGKQSRDYWLASVADTIETARVAAVIADDACAGRGLPAMVDTLAQRDLDGLADASGAPLAFEPFAIVQLSSGTTGHRKAIGFDSAQVRRHVLDYNQSLALSERDTIVSWLPLYHDMGLIACFVMPMMLKAKVVMIDPMTWVKRPGLLYEAIERHDGTVCYMPNFGYEVMARCGPKRLPSVRWWISCSEPVAADTARRFLDLTGAAPDSFAPCYAMAENVFALAIRRGLKTHAIDGVEVVSCGAPIAGVALKTLGDDIWASSPSALRAYLGGADIRDAQGFYPTGDCGRLIDGELHVTGRQQDVLIQAGAKFMLSDLDLMLNRVYPQARGRAAAVALHDERLGTERPLILIEAADFFARADRGGIADAVTSAAGLDRVEVRFVPPRFLTKTSSGKFNRRKSAADWRLHRQAARRSREGLENPLAELRQTFAHVAWDRPVEEVLDSLSLTVLRIILNGVAVAHDGTLSLAAIAAQLAALPSRIAARPGRDTVRLVSLADRRIVQGIDESHLDRLAGILGSPVTLEHVCLPPAAIVLSDLIFYDYFAPRIDNGPLTAVGRAFAKLRQASIILIDDIAEMFFPPAQVYGVLSHRLERDRRADLIAVRWQRYAQCHDRLPLTVVSGADLPLEHRSGILDRLSAYLNKPLFRIATIEGFAGFTTGWDYRRLRPGAPAAAGFGEPDDLIEQLGRWATRLNPPVERFPGADSARIETSDLRHYCSHFADKAQVDKLLAEFDSFCIAGQAASIPYIPKELARLGKRFVRAASYAPEILKSTPEKFDCLLICGAMGNYPIETPAAAIMKASAKRRTFNIEAEEIATLSFTVRKANLPTSGDDWFYPFEFGRTDGLAEVRALRTQGRKKARRLARQLARGRASLDASGGPDTGRPGAKRDSEGRRMAGPDAQPTRERPDRAERPASIDAGHLEKPVASA